MAQRFSDGGETWPFLFVLETHQVIGIVTPGDFQKIAARMYFFGLLSLLEMEITRWIEMACAENPDRVNTECGAIIARIYRNNNRYERWAEDAGSYVQPLNLEEKVELFQCVFSERAFTDELCNLRQKLKNLRDKLAHPKSMIHESNTGQNIGRWADLFSLVEQVERILDQLDRNSIGG